MNLFAFAISGEHALIIVLGAVAVAALIGWLLRKDTAQEKRRKAYVQLATFLQQWGFNKLASIVTNIAVGDYSGVVQETMMLAEMMRDPKQAMVILSENFLYQLPKRLDDAGDRIKLLEIVDAWRAAHPEVPTVAK